MLGLSTKKQFLNLLEILDWFFGLWAPGLFACSFVLLSTNSVGVNPFAVPSTLFHPSLCPHDKRRAISASSFLPSWEFLHRPRGSCVPQTNSLPLGRDGRSNKITTVRLLGNAAQPNETPPTLSPSGSLRRTLMTLSSGEGGTVKPENSQSERRVPGCFIWS